MQVVLRAVVVAIGIIAHGSREALGIVAGGSVAEGGLVTVPGFNLGTWSAGHPAADLQCPPGAERDDQVHVPEMRLAEMPSARPVQAVTQRCAHHGHRP
jgi:hypothetical protein